MIRIVIIDDEERARKTIRSIISVNKNIDIVGEGWDVSSGIIAIEKKKPDLVLLDINLGDRNSFEILNSLNEIKFRIIFITAHEEYAVRAFKYSALNYLLKPIDASELLDSVNKMENQYSELQMQQQFNTFLAHYKEKEQKKIVLKTAEKISLVEISDIIRCESDKNYTTFYLKNQSKIVVSRTLKEYDELLAPYGFFRIHQSHLINLKHLTGLDKKDGGYALMTDGSAVSVSYRKKEQLLRVLDGMGI
jgi:two-component system LytT family response regulator